MIRCSIIIVNSPKQSLTYFAFDFGTKFSVDGQFQRMMDVSQLVHASILPSGSIQHSGMFPDKLITVVIAPYL